jgi:hypothetical protein
MHKDLYRLDQKLKYLVQHIDQIWKLKARIQLPDNRDQLQIGVANFYKKVISLFGWRPH